MSCSACVLLYNVTCFVLVIVRIYVPGSRTDCNSAVSNYIERVICTWFWSWWSDTLLCSLWTGSFKFIWAFTVEACEKKYEIRGLTIRCFIEVQGLEHLAWSVLCSPHCSVNILWYSLKYSLFWSRNVVQKCFESPLVALGAFMLYSGCLYLLFCYSICPE